MDKNDFFKPNDSGEYIPDRYVVQYNWKDITPEFTTSACQLNLGELIHDENFGLFEAMSAIEMMDPKMDVGMTCNKSKFRVQSIEEAKKLGRLKLKDFTIPEIISIIDDSYATLVTWLESHSLAQTVFTNLYTHNPDMAEDQTIRVFSSFMLKMVGLVRDIVSKASVAEEEDFQLLTYGFKLTSSVDNKLGGFLKELEEEYMKKVKNAKGNQDGGDNSNQLQLFVAIHARLRFSRLFFLTLNSLTKKEVKAGVEEAKKYLGHAEQCLEAITNSIALGAKPSINQLCVEDANTDSMQVVGFEPLINQRLLPPTFPRYSQVVSRGQAVDYLQALVSRLQTVCDVITLTSMSKITEFMSKFSEQCPCVLSRSILQNLVMAANRKVFGEESPQELLKSYIRSFVSPPVLLPRSALSNNAQAKEYTEVFVSHAVKTYCNLLKIHGFNRARQREKLANILEDLNALQDEAEKVDAALHELAIKQESSKYLYMSCFGSWVLYHTLQVMIQYIYLGFELKLYSPHEYHYIFWYVSEFLYGWLISTLGRADNYVAEQDITEQSKGKSSKKKTKKKKVHPHQRELVNSQAYQHLCGGYYKVVVGLMIEGKLPTPLDAHLDSEQLRYEHRFFPFTSINAPPPVPYSHFAELTDPSKYDDSAKITEIYLGAVKCFQQAKAMFEHLLSDQDGEQEIQNLTKIAKTNFVVAKLLAGGHHLQSIRFEFTDHKVFPTIKLS